MIITWLAEGDMTVPAIRVLCVDDHSRLSGKAFRSSSTCSDMQIVGLAATGEEALALFNQHHPDVTLMDLQLPGISGLEAIKRIHTEDPKARVIVLTMYEGDEDIYRALKAGSRRRTC